MVKWCYGFSGGAFDPVFQLTSLDDPLEYIGTRFAFNSAWASGDKGATRELFANRSTAQSRRAVVSGSGLSRSREVAISIYLSSLSESFMDLLTTVPVPAMAKGTRMLEIKVPIADTFSQMVLLESSIV